MPNRLPDVLVTGGSAPWRRRSDSGTPTAEPVDGLALAELWACALDGELTPMGAGFVPVDLPNCAETRAKSLAEYCSWHATVERSSAAWVHGATAREPWPHTIAIDADARFALPRCPEFLVREVRIPRRHVIEVGGVRVTTALRTAIDLARTTPRHPDPGAAAGQSSERDRAREWEMSLRETLWRLIVLCGATDETITRELSSTTNLPNRHLASERLRAARPARPARPAHPARLPQSRLPAAGEGHSAASRRGC